MSTPETLFKRYFAFDIWGNRLHLNFLKEHKAFTHRIEALKLFSHVMAVQRVWLTRIQGKDSSSLEIWPDLNIPECETLLDRFESQWPELLAQKDTDLNQIIRYRNSKGKPFENSLEELLTHIVIHGQHHRAQISTLIRRSDLTPPPIDFIYFCRES